MVANQETLRQLLHQLDQRGYKAYKEIQGTYQFPEFRLIIDYVQGDPFANPSQIRVTLSHEVAKFPEFLYESKSREIALRDFLTRQFAQVAKNVNQHRGMGKSGLISFAAGATPVGQEVLERTTVLINAQGFEVRFVVGLPARGRTVLGFQAAQMLCDDIPDIVEQSLKYQAVDGKALQNHVELVEDADWLRQELVKQGLVAFVADHSILPRFSGVDDRPLRQNAIAFQSPDALKVTFTLPNRGLITGMGIPKGITLIVGGGYHGKSTLLQVIAKGVYNHIPGDGRELIVSHPDAVKIRAEDGRSVAGVNISAFINHLPQNKSTRDFSTENASGSTSQAAGILEALEVGAKVLLIDEDTSATNFMIRDRRMQALIAKDVEPITPLIDKIAQLYTDYQVSTILVMGGSGDYFEVANTVIAMENFQPLDVTEKAKTIAQAYPTARQAEGGGHFGKILARIPLSESLDPSRGERAVKLKIRDVEGVVFGTEDIDVAAVEQIVESGQLRAIAEAMVYAKEYYLDNRHTLAAVLDCIFADIQTNGLESLTRHPQGNLVAFRRHELAAAINRLRTLKVKLKA